MYSLYYQTYFDTFEELSHICICLQYWIILENARDIFEYNSNFEYNLTGNWDFNEGIIPRDILSEFSHGKAIYPTPNYKEFVSYFSDIIL